MLKQPDAFQLPHRVDFKEKYAPTWAIKGNPREAIAFHELKALFGLSDSDIVLTGKGALSDQYIDDPLESPPDFYVPKLDRFFEVTGSDLTREQSMQRCTAKFHRAEPCLFIREGKVEAARLNRVASKLCFISVNEMDGSVLFLPCAKAVKYPLVEGYERGGERYYMVPWVEWMRPYRFVSSLRREL